MSVIITLIIFGIIVIIHEFGHFYAARKCGIGVIEFAVGMGPKLLSFNKNGIIYSIRAVPVGGFCRMKGEEADDYDCFQNASLIKRIIVVLAGPFMNFILAYIIFTIFVMLVPMATTNVADVGENTPAYEAGIKKDDKIVKINNNPIRIYSDFEYFMENYDGGEITVKVKDSQGNRTVNLTPDKIKDENGERYVMGIMCQVKSPFFGKGLDGYEKAGLFESLKGGFWYMPFMVKVTVSGLISLFTANISLDAVSGPIGLTNEVGTVYDKAKSSGIKTILLSMASITGILSANLGVMNLLPIPALDGGRFLFFIIEAVRGKQIPPEKEGIVNLVGFAIIAVFGLVIAFNDILKIF